MQMERVFKDYGLPSVIRSDNGSPFASIGAGGLTALSVWWLKLGIGLERIAAGHPEQNGRHQRMHRTLKQETPRPPAATSPPPHHHLTPPPSHSHYHPPPPPLATP